MPNWQTGTAIANTNTCSGTALTAHCVISIAPVASMAAAAVTVAETVDRCWPSIVCGGDRYFYSSVHSLSTSSAHFSAAGLPRSIDMPLPWSAVLYRPVCCVLSRPVCIPPANRGVWPRYGRQLSVGGVASLTARSRCHLSRLPPHSLPSSYSLTPPPSSGARRVTCGALFTAGFLVGT